MDWTRKSTARGGLTLLGMLVMCSGYAGDEFEASGFADMRSLRGDYGFSLTQSCVRTPFGPPPAAGFDPNTLQLLVDGELINSVGTGKLRFAKDGVVKLEDGFLTEISASALSAGQTPVSAGTQFVCSGNYSLQQGGKLTVSLSCDVVTAQPGPTVTLKPLNFEGSVGEGRRSINLSTPRREIHTVAVSNAGTIVLQRERICLQSMNLDKL